MEPIRPLDNKTVTEVPRPLNTVQKQHIPRKIVLEAAGHGVCREADIRQHGLQGHVFGEDGGVGMGGVKIAYEFCTWKRWAVRCIVVSLPVIACIPFVSFSMQMNILLSIGSDFVLRSSNVCIYTQGLCITQTYRSIHAPYLSQDLKNCVNYWSLPVQTYRSTPLLHIHLHLQKQDTLA